MDRIAELADNLTRGGIKYAFGVAGGGASLSLISSLEKINIPYYPVAHEAAAALMAGACSRQGKPAAVAIGIKGPGFVNFLPGVVSNYYEGRPALTVSEAYAPETPLYRKHKRLDHRAMASPAIKGYLISDGGGEAVSDLLKLAGEELPGPIHMDLCNEPVQNGLIQPDILYRAAPAADLSELEKILKCVRESSRPALILGSLATRALAPVKWEKAGVPVVTTAAAKGCIDENNPFAGGVITGEIKELSPEIAVLSKADLIIAFGLRNSEVIQPVNFHCPLIMIDTMRGDLHQGFDAEIDILAADGGEAIGLELLAALNRKSWGEDIIRAHRHLLEAELFREKWLPAHVFRLVQEIFTDGLLVMDTGLFCTIGETVWKARVPGDFCGSSNGRFMGTSVPTAIGAALSSPGKTIICIAGDGGIRPYLPELKIAVAEKLPIIFILLSDGRYGTVAVAARTKKLSLRATEIDYPGWWQCAEIMGCPAGKIGSARDLAKMAAAWKQKGPLFLEISFDPEIYSSMTQKLR